MSAEKQRFINVYISNATHLFTGDFKFGNSDTKVSPTSHPVDEPLKPSSPTSERFRGQIGFGNSEESDPRKHPGDSE